MDIPPLIVRSSDYAVDMSRPRGQTDVRLFRAPSIRSQAKGAAEVARSPAM